jgi:HK97 family phage prohead protease
MITHYSGTVEKFASGLGERQIRIVASDATRDRAGDILDPLGCDLTAYRKNPVILFGHDARNPVARAIEIGKTSQSVTAKVQFPNEGDNDESDRIYRLVKGGTISAVSVGFSPVESTPLRNGGVKYTKWELLEISLVSVPCNPNAVVTARSLPDEDIRERARALVASVRADDAFLMAREHARALLSELRADDAETSDPETVK